MAKKRKKKVHKTSVDHQESRPMDKIKLDKEKTEEQSELLEKIYAVKINDEFSTDDLTKFYYRKRTWWASLFKYFGILFVFVGFGLIAGYFYFTYGGQFKGSEIHVSIVGSNSVVAGEPVKYEIIYENRENARLKNLKMIVRYPDNFVLLSSQPVTVESSENTWDLPDLGANSRGKLVLEGYFTGVVGSSENIYRFFDVDFYYNSENFNSLFNSSVQSQVVIKQAGVNFSLESLGTWQVNQSSTLMLHYGNDENSSLRGLVVKANIPEDFVLVSSQPEISEKKQHDGFYEVFWNIDELLPKTKQYILLDGYFKNIPANGLPVEIYGELFMQQEDKKTILSDDKLSFVVEGKTISLDLKVLDKSVSQSLSDLETVVFQIAYMNNSGAPLKNVELELWSDDFISKNPLLHVLNWNTVEDSNDGSIHRTDPGAKINWDKSSISNFGLLEDGQGGELLVKIKRYPKSKFVDFPNWRDFSIKNYLLFTYEDDNGKRQTLNSQMVVFDFRDRLDLVFKGFDELGEAADGKFLYKLNYDLKFLPIDKSLYGIDYKFILADKVFYLDWLKDSNLNKENLSIDYSQYYDENLKQVVVKFSNAEKCARESCSFSFVVSSSNRCDNFSCFVKSFLGQARLDNQFILDR